MKKLIMNGVLKYFSSDILSNLNLPVIFKRQIKEISEIIRETGKGYFSEGKKQKNGPFFLTSFQCLIFNFKLRLLPINDKK
mmetsp:Transcript_1239/g.134  ORF Transcript_1239/g.134 Transcript_1239/m.134 type:complete len:81 (-) Transcript_1239:525-767(-)